MADAAGSKERSDVPRGFFRSLRGRLRPLVGLALLALALLLVRRTVLEVGWQDLRARVLAADPGWLVTAAACLVAQLWLWGYRWKVAIRRVDLTPRRRVIYGALAAAASINQLAPFARVFGGLLRARYLSHAGQHSAAAFYGVVLFDQLTHFVVMTSLTLLAAVAACALSGRWLIAAVAATFTVLVTAAFLGWERSARSSPGGLARRVAAGGIGTWGPTKRLFALGQETVAMLARLLEDRRLRLHTTILGVGVFLLGALGQAAVFYALGERPRLMVVLVTVALGTAAGTLAGTPGGLGATEATMIAVFTALGVGRLEAAAAALLYRALYYVVVFSTGVPAALLLELGVARRRRALPPGLP